MNKFTSIVRLFDAIAAAIAVFLGLASAPIEARVLVERDRD